MTAWLHGSSSICVPGREHRQRGRFIVRDGELDLKYLPDDYCGLRLLRGRTREPENTHSNFLKQSQQAGFPHVLLAKGLGQAESPAGSALPGKARLILNTCWVPDPELGAGRVDWLWKLVRGLQKKKEIKLAIKYVMHQPRRNNTHKCKLSTGPQICVFHR